MTMMMTNSQFGLEDMEDLLWGPSSPMADVVDFHSVYPDQQKLEEGGRASPEQDTPPVSPLNSFSPPSSSSPPFFSPPPSPTHVLFHEDKVGTESDLLSLSSIDRLGQLRQVALDDSKEEMLSDLDWMAERVDIGEFDLESLIGSCSTDESPSSPIGSCSTDESPSSPEGLLAFLDCAMELDSLPLPALSTPAPAYSPSASSINALPLTPTPPPTATSEPSVIMVEDSESSIEAQDVCSPPPCVPEPLEELEIKCEPDSPVLDSPPSPAYTLELGSEVDVSESEVEQVVTPVVPPVQRVVLSLSPTRLIFVLAPKKEVGLPTPTVTSTAEVIRVCVPQKPCRSRPYPAPTPTPTAGPTSPSGSCVKIRPKTKAKGKKLKKMEQNKTAATRYRQKKKYEKEVLLGEYTILERKNMELKEKAESMAREIEYLKELMEEVRQTRMKKGLSPDP